MRAVSGLRLVVRGAPGAVVGWPSRLRLRRCRVACPICNIPEGGEEPRMPEGFETDIDKDGWRN
jgi:hypothetical protein